MSNDRDQTPDRPTPPTASKPTTPASAKPLSERLKLGPHSLDVTSAQSGKKLGIVGTETFRNKIAQRL